MTSTTEQNAGTVVRVDVPSRYLGETREVNVYLPHNYTPLYKYPTLYVNDGADYMMMGRMISMLNQRFENRLARRFLVVFVPVDKALRHEEYSPKGSRHEAFVRFFGDELVPAIEEKFAAFPMGPARGIMGSSLGAVAALHTLLAYSRKFHYLALQSGAYGERSFEAAAGRRDLATVPVYQVVGLQEDKFESATGKTLDLLAANRKMRDLLQGHGTDVDYAEYDADHTWGFWQDDLPRALDHFVRHTNF